MSYENTTFHDVARSGTPSTLFLGSPDITVAPDGSLIAKLDEFGSAAHTDGTDWDRSQYYRSTDNGATWTLRSTVDGFFWGGFIEGVGDGNLYGIGTSRRYGSIVLIKSTDNAATWTIHTLFDGTGLYYHTAPSPTVIIDGTIYKVFERNLSAVYPIENVFVLTASVGDDLTDPASWTKSNEKTRTAADWSGWADWGWSEGNAVENANGEFEAWMRMDGTVYERAFVARMTLSGSDLSVPRYEAFDGGYTKFMIKKHSGAWYCVRNSMTVKDGIDRRTLCVLDRSDDLISWRRVAIVAEVDAALYATAGHQYPSMTFLDNDCHIVTRTAENGVAANYHDSNVILHACITNVSHK